MCVVIRTVDIDVLILLIAYSHLFIEGGVVSVLVQFGTGHNVRFYDIFELRIKIGATKCLGWPFFHAFSGCAATSSFY